MQLPKISINVSNTPDGQLTASNLNPTEKRDSRTSSPVSHDDTDDINYSSSVSPVQGVFNKSNVLSLNISVHTESHSTTTHEHHDHGHHHHPKPSNSSQIMDHHTFPGSLDNTKSPFTELPEEEEDDDDEDEDDEDDDPDLDGHELTDDPNHHRKATDDINIVYDDADDHHLDDDEEDELDEDMTLNNMVQPTSTKTKKRVFGLQISTDLNANGSEIEHNGPGLGRISVPVPESAPQSSSRTLDSMELSLSLNEKSSLLDNYKGGSLDVDSLIQRLVWSFILSLSLSL